MFTIWFTEGGKRLCEREWPIVPRVGETLTLKESNGLFEVIRVHWEEHTQAQAGLVANVSLRSSSS
ncbi:MAG TPA: hypothetical protein VH107_15420 [Lacipirellulaceae bacterium]|jgi:hypothetical protein|nr:hypothetical protein [Lacipirellulaceae bacterium]